MSTKDENIEDSPSKYKGENNFKNKIKNQYWDKKSEHITDKIHTGGEYDSEEVENKSSTHSTKMKKRHRTLKTNTNAETSAEDGEKTLKKRKHKHSKSNRESYQNENISKTDLPLDISAMKSQPNSEIQKNDDEDNEENNYEQEFDQRNAVMPPSPPPPPPPICNISVDLSSFPSVSSAKKKRAKNPTKYISNGQNTHDKEPTIVLQVPPRKPDPNEDLMELDSGTNLKRVAQNLQNDVLKEKEQFLDQMASRPLQKPSTSSTKEFQKKKASLFGLTKRTIINVEDAHSEVSPFPPTRTYLFLMRTKEPMIGIASPLLCYSNTVLDVIKAYRKDFPKEVLCSRPVELDFPTEPRLCLLGLDNWDCNSENESTRWPWWTVVNYNEIMSNLPQTHRKTLQASLASPMNIYIIDSHAEALPENCQSVCFAPTENMARIILTYCLVKREVIVCEAWKWPIKEFVCAREMWETFFRFKITSDDWLQRTMIARSELHPRDAEKQQNTPYLRSPYEPDVPLTLSKEWF